MDDDQTDPECVLLLAMERAFRGPEYANTKTKDWRTHMARVLNCVRWNDPMLHDLRAELARLQAENERLREAFNKYAAHSVETCDKWGEGFRGLTFYGKHACTCGFDETRAALEAK